MSLLWHFLLQTCESHTNRVMWKPAVHQRIFRYVPAGEFIS